MKKILRIFAFGIMAGSISFAQKAKTTSAPVATTTEVSGEPRSGLKLGWIVSQDLLASMPEKVKADSDISKYARAFQDQIESMMKEYQTKGQAFQAGEKTRSEPIKEVKMKEIQDLQNRIESIQQSAKEKVNQKQQDLYQPIIDKAEKAISAVAKEGNYDYIFDKNGGGLLYGKESDNILPLVKKNMGIK
jgi:outer membrane protein